MHNSGSSAKNLFVIRVAFSKNRRNGVFVVGDCNRERKFVCTFLGGICSDLVCVYRGRTVESNRRPQLGDKRFSAGCSALGKLILVS